MSDVSDDMELSRIYNIQPADNLADELDPNFRPFPAAPHTDDDSLDSGIAGPDIPDVDPHFSQPSQGLDGDDDASHGIMPLPDEFTSDPLTLTSTEEYQQYELLAQFPYLIGQALRVVLLLSADMDVQTKYTLLHDAKAYLLKAIECYDPDVRPALFTHDGCIKGTQIGCYVTSCPKAGSAWIRDTNVRKVYAASNPYIKALLMPCSDEYKPRGLIFWGLKPFHLKSMLSCIQASIEEVRQLLPGHNIGD